MGHMTEEEIGIKMKDKGLGRAEVKVDLKIEILLVPGMEVRKGVIIAESQDIL